MKMAEKKFYFSEKVIFLISFSWLFITSFFFVRDWSPFSLFLHQGAILPQDIAASLIKIFLYGLTDILFLILVMLSAFGAGFLLLRPFGLEPDRPQQALLALAAGLGVLSYATLFIGIAQGYTRNGLFLIILFISIFAVIGIKRLLIRPSYLSIPKDNLQRLFFFLLMMEGIFLLAKALMPTVFYDAITYHLGVPNYYILEGGIKYIPYDSFSNFPFLAEMMYTIGLFLHGLKLAQMTSVLVFLAFALAVYNFSKTFFKEINPALPGLIFLSIPAFIENTNLYTNDLHLAYFTLMAIYCLFLWREKEENKYIVLAALFTGFCLATKYIALISCLLPFAVLIGYFLIKRQRPLREWVKIFTLFFVPAFLVFSPWVIKNLIYTGNPFYPAFFNIFGGRDMSGEMYAVIQSMSGKPALADGFHRFISNGWGLFLNSPKEINIKYGASAYLSPLPLVFFPLFFLIKERNERYNALAVIFLIMFVCWNFTFPLTRFLYPAIAVLVLLTAFAFAVLYKTASKAMKYILGTTLAFYILFGVLLGFYQADLWAGDFGFSHLNENAEEYMARQLASDKGFMLSSYPVEKYINENAEPDARVLIIGDAQHLFIKRRHEYSYLSASDPCTALCRDEKTATAYLKAEGINYIIYNPRELRRLQRSQAVSFKENGDRSLENFLNGTSVKLIYASNGRFGPVLLYKVL